jgi:hypothetical protein
VTPAIEDVVVSILTRLESRRWTGSSERLIQEAIAGALVMTGDPFLDHSEVTVLREHRFDARDRCDFAVRVGVALIVVEVKISGSTVSVAKQIQRYASHKEVAVVILASASARLVAAVPAELGGKRVARAYLRRL